ncbi:MAG TPA: SGNH/GDSL hydrolase family protein [Noviherbaspirillum sp.]|jgi:lysophospholipase L1-like esterase|uniref:SGNH/GDSL hydrolase family protein n=1 Tax=Noviherbaspirillum sp. TaxID=1926288 RepID=UPI002F95175B
MRRYLAELIAVPLLPLLLAQGRRTRRVTPRLPEAAGPEYGLAPGAAEAAPLSLLAIGESPVAGVGVDSHEHAITCRFAHALASRTGRPVRWRACGKNGITASEALDQLLSTLPEKPVDIALVAFGVNDTTAFRSTTRWRADLLALCRAVQARCTPRLLIVCGVPPVGRFPALPQPLRMVLGLKAEALDAVARSVADTLPQTLYIPLALDPDDRRLMASDGYHPSAEGCNAWAAALAQTCHERIPEARADRADAP